MDLAERIAAVRERIAAACERSGRDPTTVTLVGVTKGVTVAAISAAIAAGLGDIGENRVQEAEEKKEGLGPAIARWHLIGHLQRNKARAAISLFDIIHSVDSHRLAEELSRRAAKSVPVLLEVNVAAEPSKFGFLPHEASAAITSIASLPNIELRGLMTVAPLSADPEAARPVFRQLRSLAEANGLKDLSMGMTDDFEVAVEEGATLVRIGRAIFGERPQ